MEKEYLKKKEKSEQFCEKIINTQNKIKRSNIYRSSLKEIEGELELNPEENFQKYILLMRKKEIRMLNRNPNNSPFLEETKKEFYSLLHQNQKEEAEEISRNYSKSKLEIKNSFHKKKGNSGMSIESSFAKKRKIYMDIFQEITDWARTNNYYFFDLQVELNSPFQFFKKDPKNKENFIVNPNMKKGLTHLEQANIFQEFELKILDSMKKRGQRIKNIKHLQILNLNESLNFSSHFLFLIPPSSTKKKKREFLDKINISLKNAKSLLKEKIGRTKKKILTYSEKAYLPYFFKSIDIKKTEEEFHLLQGISYFLEKISIFNHSSLGKDLPLTIIKRLYDSPRFYKEVVPTYKLERNSISIVKKHFLFIKRKIEVYQYFNDETASFSQKIEKQEDVLYKPKEEFSIDYIVYVNEITLHKIENNEDPLTLLLVKEKISISYQKETSEEFHSLIHKTLEI